MATLLVRTAKAEGAEVDLLRLEPAFVERLRKSSAITSAVASCAIEGIKVAEARAEELVNEPPPRSRDASDVLNYKRALEYLYDANPSALQVTPELIRSLHGLALASHSQTGSYKTKDNRIIDVMTGRLRFTPVSANETEAAVESLCLLYNSTLQTEIAPPQVCVAALVLDFTCIHPFADGNGRVSRQLTTAALLELGFKMPKLVSLEEIIVNDDHLYYDALAKSSHGWHTGNHNLAPFLRFHLETLARGYEDLQQILLVKEPVIVIFDLEIPATIREKAFKEFKETYENANWKTDNLRAKARKITIEGYVSLPAPANFESLKHANRLAERCLHKAETQRPRGNDARDENIPNHP